jgi:hypothetical protein
MIAVVRDHVCVDYRSWLPGLHAMRDALIAALGESDMSFSPGGTNLAWSDLLSEAVAIQSDYLASFATLSMSWSSPEPGLPLDQVRARFAAQDASMAECLARYGAAGMTEVVARPDLSRTRAEQVEAYAQFALIFLARASVYVRAQGRQLPPSVAQYVG